MMISFVTSVGINYSYYDIDSEIRNINYNIPDSINEGIKGDMIKIKEIEDGTDFLSEYIDNI